MSKGFDLGGLLQKAQELQERLAGVKQEIETRTVEGRAGGGMVTVTMNGRLEVLAVRIEPTLLDPPDRDMLQDLVVAAANDAIRSAQAMLADEMQKVTGGLKIPGLG